MTDGPDKTVILAIEASQRVAGVAVQLASGDVDVEMVAAGSGRGHDDDLLPAIDRVFKRNGLQPGDLAAVGTSVGPGGFTGLRIAVTTAKMLVETTGASAVAVPTALAVAENFGRQEPDATGPIVVALASKGETFWITSVHRGSHGWQIAEAGHLVDAATLEVTGNVVMLADGYLPDAARDVCEREGVPVVTPDLDPRGVLSATLRLLQLGETVDPLLLSPLYPRPPEAVSIWEKRKRRDEAVQ